MKKKQLRLEDLPVYDITIEEDGTQGIRMVSLVKDPAIEVKGMYFSAVDLEKEKLYEFKSLPDKQIVVGPAMIPNKKILRKDKNDNFYYVRFSEDIITKMVDKFNKENNNKSINIDHTSNMAPAFIRANWQIEDPLYDKSRIYGFDLPKKSWFIEVKIEDSKFWENEVKDANRFSFSIEGLMGQELVEMEEFLTIDKFIDSLTEDELKDLLEFADEPYNLQPDNPDSTWFTHPHCKCTFKGNKWTTVPSADGKYPCDICINMAKKWRQAQRSGKRGGYNFSDIKNISFDYDGTLSDPKVQEIAEQAILDDNNVFIITKRQSGDKAVLNLAMELGIKKSNVIFTNGEPKWTYLIDNSIDIHYDNEQDEIEQMKQKTSAKLININYK